MSLGHGASIVRNGLIFHYDLGNTQKSWKGAPTTNLAPYTDYSNRTYDSKYDIGGWGGDDADVYYYRNGGWNGLPYKKMIKHTGGTGGSYINEHSYFTLVEGKTYVISCYMKANINVTVSGHTLALNRGSDNAYRVPADISLTTSWTRYVWTYTCAAGEGGTTYHFRQIVYNDANLPVEVYWSALQIEEGTVASPYVNGTRSNTQALVDLKNYDTIQVVGANLQYNNNSITVPKVNNSYIQTVNPSKFAMGTQDFTLSTWVKQIDAEQYNALVEARGASLQGYLFILNYPTTGKISVFINSSSGQTSYSSSNSSLGYGTVQNITAVVSRTNAKIYLYVNGMLFDTLSGLHASSITPASDALYRMGYDKGGSTANIELFAHMHYSRTLSAAEVKQNFEALRGRYGI